MNVDPIEEFRRRIPDGEDPDLIHIPLEVSVPAVNTYGFQLLVYRERIVASRCIYESWFYTNSTFYVCTAPFCCEARQ